MSDSCLHAAHRGEGYARRGMWDQEDDEACPEPEQIEPEADES